MFIWKAVSVMVTGKTKFRKAYFRRTVYSCSRTDENIISILFNECITLTVYST